MHAIEKNNKNFEQWYEQISSLIFTTIKSFYEACVLYVQKLDENPSFKDFCLNKMPSGPWNTFEQVGRKQLIPDLYFKSGVGFNYLRRLSYSDQKRFLNEPIEYLTSKNDILKIEISNLTPEQSKQVFSSNPPHIRTIPEQRAYKESIQVPDKKPQTMPYHIMRGGKVNINGVIFTLSQLHHICEEMSR